MSQSEQVTLTGVWLWVVCTVSTGVCFSGPVGAAPVVASSVFRDASAEQRSGVQPIPSRRPAQVEEAGTVSDLGNGSLEGTEALDEEERAFLRILNAYRAQNGLSPMEVSVTLTRASDWMSRDMATKNYFSHEDSKGRDPFTRMKDFNYPVMSARAENLAAGNEDGQQTFSQWKNSPGHNSNMLHPRLRFIGIARAFDPESEYKWYWTTDFGSVKDRYAENLGRKRSVGETTKISR